MNDYMLKDYSELNLDLLFRNNYYSELLEKDN